MKLKSILGVCVATAAMTASCFNCFAADEAITYGAPIDLATAQEVSGDIVAGTHIAVPVELSNSDGRTTSFAAKVLYDNEYVTPGATDSELSDDEYNNLIALGNSDDGCVLRNSTSTTDLIVKNIYTLGRGGKKTIQGTWVAVPNSESINKFAVAWASGTADGYAFSSEPELYFIYTVKKTIPADELNKEMFTGTPDSTMKAVEGITAGTTKINATQGAFKVVLDADALPNGNWVQGLYAQVGSTKQNITACVHADGTTTYEFPVRVNSATGATDSITVDVYATTTADEAGTKTATDKKVGSIVLSMDGTVTSYNTLNASISSEIGGVDEGPGL